MFTLDLQEAISWLTSDDQIVVKFVVVLENGRKLPVYYVTISSLMGVLENIYAILESVIAYCSAKGYAYICLFGVSCV